MKEVVILGAGYAGLKALHKLQKSNLDFHITLIDQNDYHCEKISLAEVAAGSLKRDDICFKITDIIKTRKTTFLQDQVTKIDPEEKIVFLKQKEIKYDYAIVSLGFIPETFGIKGAEKFALHMTNIDEAEAIYKHILDELAAYKKDNDPKHLNIVVCGAGFTGVELLGDLLDQRTKNYSKNFDIKPENIKLTCINGSDHFLPMFPPKLAEYGINNLKKRGVNFIIGHVCEVKEGTVSYKFNDEIKEINAGSIIWTTGVSGSSVITDSNLESHRNRVKNNQDLTFANYHETYFTGDVAAFFPDENKSPYPTTAQIALQMGDIAAQNVLNQIENKPTEKFSYRNLGTVASLGNSNAFGIALNMHVRGYIASVTKKMIDDLSLIETGGIKELLSCGKFDFYH